MKHDMDYSCIRENCGGTCFGCTLGSCKGCGQYEGGLATECPGVIISEEQAQAIYTGKIDFVDGHWKILVRKCACPVENGLDLVFIAGCCVVCGGTE